MRQRESGGGSDVCYDTGNTLGLSFVTGGSPQLMTTLPTLVKIPLVLCDIVCDVPRPINC